MIKGFRGESREMLGGIFVDVKILNVCRALVAIETIHLERTLLYGVNKLQPVHGIRIAECLQE